MDYPAERFARTPISHIHRIIDELDNCQQSDANLASITSAQLCHLVRQAIHIFSQSAGSTSTGDPRQYLPFPEWAPPKAEPKGPSEMTALVLRDALRRREIPMHVFVALISPPEGES